MDAGGIVWNVAVSRDGKWIVSGTESGQVMVWNAESHKKVTEFKAHSNLMRALDVSPDGKMITTGSDDKTVCIWSLQTGQRLLSWQTWQHSFFVVAVKVSPNGAYIATATWFRHSVRIYSAHDDNLRFDIPVRVTLSENQSLAWTNNSSQLFALSYDRNIHCISVSNGATLSQWPIHNTSIPMCIALANNGTFIAVSVESSVSFWDVATHKKIGSVIKHTAHVGSIAISASYDIVVSGGKTITLRSLCDIIPLPYSDHVSANTRIRRLSNPNHFSDCCRLSLSGPWDARKQTQLISRRLLNCLSLIVTIFVHMSRAYVRSWVHLIGFLTSLSTRPKNCEARKYRP